MCVPNLPSPKKPLSASQGVESGCPGQRLLALDPVLEPVAGPTLALAFRDNPINRAVIRGNRARRTVVNTYGMEASLSATRRYSFRRVTREEPEGLESDLYDGITGGLLALDPGGYPSAFPSIGSQLRCLWGQGFRVMHRWGQLYRLLDACHPREPHCYLSLLATHPERRRRGIGRALLSAWLRDVDERAMPSYLETDRKELLAFYQSAGFAVEREIEAFGTPIWCMSRAAQLR